MESETLQGLTSSPPLLAGGELWLALSEADSPWPAWAGEDPAKMCKFKRPPLASSLGEGFLLLVWPTVW